ncbi:hypothetical protein HCN44_011189 [Aphidius gifuensis]|uniref:phospholipase A1 n=1 Tax=Aphidius gifuensis TaxID=684658 RepID=A0A835CV17_APHGI|nr:hypothetical protein HCN44_011189 [Aphidius gifuensis]
MAVSNVFFNLVFVWIVFKFDSVSSIHGLIPRVINPTLCNRIAKELRIHGKKEEPNIPSKLSMKIYTGNTIARSTVINIPMTEPEEIFHYIDHEKPLVIYIHGFREHPSNESIRTVVGAHLERGTDNIFLLDWSKLAFDPYLTVITRLKEIAKIFAYTFDTLVDLGLDLDNFHLVGHSLGAQISGFFGRFSNYTIPRITGLDPAFPGFYHFGAEHIDADSATFVDILHTDGGFYGALENTGTADFYDLCNHWMSWRYYAESVKNNFAFIAVKCSSHIMYTMGKCRKNHQVFFGYGTPRNSRGSYYFKTSAKSPYGNKISNYSWG